ncbi:MAG: GNAT family N-acetyltransferase [Firmicutes bacterium]|nr:GNAT family N-acetyltransferase [Bacillota bacterium]
MEVTDTVDFGPFTILPFLPGDIPEVLALWSSTPGIGVGRGDTPEELCVFLERQPGLSFIARRDGELVGAVLGATDARRGYIHHLAVREDCRGLGLGRALLARAVDALRARGVPKVHLFVFVGNDPAIGFYRHLGWEWREDLRVMSLNL